MKKICGSYLCLVLLTVLAFLCRQSIASPARSMTSPKATLPKSQPLPPAQLKGKIAYIQSDKKGDSLWVVDPENGKPHLLFSSADLGSQVLNVDFSPDRTLIAFSNPALGNIFVMRWDGKNRRQLTHHLNESCASPRFSPSGKQIVYTRTTGYIMGGGPKYSKEIRLINMDGTNDHVLAGTTHGMGPAAFDAYWSRDEKTLIFTFYDGPLDLESDSAVKREFRTMSLDGSNQQSFDGDWSSFDTPSVSEDGKYNAEFVNEDGARFLRLFTYPPKTFAGTLWAEDAGFYMRGVPCLNASGSKVAFVGFVRTYQMDAKGYLLRDPAISAKGLYLIDRQNRKQGLGRPRLLMPSAGLTLIDWL